MRHGHIGQNRLEGDLGAAGGPAQWWLNLQCPAFSRCQGNTVAGHGAAGGRPGTSLSRDAGCAGAHAAPEPEAVTVDIQGAPGPRAGAAAGSRAHGPCTRGEPHAHTCAGLRFGGRIRRSAADTGPSPGLRWGFCASAGWRSGGSGGGGEAGCAGLGGSRRCPRATVTASCASGDGTH